MELHNINPRNFGAKIPKNSPKKGTTRSGSHLGGIPMGNDSKAHQGRENLG